MKRTKLLRNVPALRPLADDELSAVSGAGAALSDISLTKSYDKASPVLFKACCSGEHLKEAKLTA